MSSYHYLLLDVFTDRPFGGNPKEDTIWVLPTEQWVRGIRVPLLPFSQER